MLTVRDLPSINASLNATATVLLLSGLYFIKNGRQRAHRNAMLAASACSVLFLVSYLIYHAHVGSVRFQGTGFVRTLYLTILATHTVLAATVPVLVAITLTVAFRQRFARHRAIARWTFPIWLYVSVTGVVIYWMLYQMQWT